MARFDELRDRPMTKGAVPIAANALHAVLCDRGLPQRTLLGCVAHDLSGPLTYVQWDVDALARLIDMLRQAVDQSTAGAGFERLCEAHPKMARAYHEVPTLMEHIKAGLQRLQSLSKDLALLAEDDLTPQAFDVRDAVTTALRLIRPFVTRRLQVSYEPGDSPQPVQGNLADIVTAIINLGLNAAEANPAGPAEGRLWITFESTRQHVVLRLVDNGSGFATEHPTELLTPGATGREGRCGLGLAVVKRVVDDHQGTVSLKTSQPTGAAITIQLPRRATQP